MLLQFLIFIQHGGFLLACKDFGRTFDHLFPACMLLLLFLKNPKYKYNFCHIIIIMIYPLTTTVVGAPRMISQPVSHIILCSLLLSGTWQTPGPSIPWCCLPTSSSVCLVFFPFSLFLARWLWPDLMNGKHDHTTAVCVFLRSSGDLHVVQLPAGSWHRLPRW